LDCGGWTPLWIFPIDALYSHPKLRQAGALQDTLTATKRLGLLRHLGDPQPFAPSRLRVRPLPLLPNDRLHFQISNFRFPRSPQPPNPRLSTPVSELNRPISLTPQLRDLGS
jgi:hypothetical protein